MTSGRLFRTAFTLIFVASLGAALGGCSTFRIEPEGSGKFPPTSKIQVVWKQPSQPFVVIARFSGTEDGLCARSRPYCSLYKKAMHLGANAIWVQQRIDREHPGLWYSFQNQWRYIPPSQYEEVKGVFLRYTQ